MSTVFAPSSSSFEIADLTVFSTSLSIFLKYSFGMPIFMPFMSLPQYFVKSSVFFGMLVWSKGSFPDIIESISAESFTVFDIGPILSSELA